MKNSIITSLIATWAMFSIVACGDDSSGPSPASSSSEVVSSSSEVASSSSELVSSSSSEEVSSSSSLVDNSELVVLEQNITEKAVYFDLASGTATPADLDSWEIQVAQKGQGYGLILNTEATNGFIVIDKAFDDVGEEDLPSLDDNSADWKGVYSNEVMDLDLTTVETTTYLVALSKFDPATGDYSAPNYVKFSIVIDWATYATSVRQANLDGSDDETVLAFGYYSLSEKSEINSIPEKWSLLFGSYRTDIGEPKRVAGALSNLGASFQVAIDSTNEFNTISSIDDYEFSDELDAVGDRKSVV